jgi:branched-chain amino acid transport system ATP-binding protein
MHNNGSLLEVANVTKRFGGLVALDDVTLTVCQGDLWGIIGPNGAGKTTLFNLISGDLKPTSGNIKLRGDEITGAAPDAICRKGISRTFQLTRIFPEMTVYESVWVGVNSNANRPWNPFVNSHKLRDLNERTLHICEMVGLEERLNDLAINLSYGDQKILEIAMALSTDPALLLLDEPTQGVSPKETDAIMEVIEHLSDNITIVLIEHTIEVVVRLCNVLTVLSDGAVLAQGTPQEIRNNIEVQRIYLGELE